MWIVINIFLDIMASRSPRKDYIFDLSDSFPCWQIRERYQKHRRTPTPVAWACTAIMSAHLTKQGILSPIQVIIKLAHVSWAA